MKAEHRKELQTNALADFLGRTVRNVRTGSGIPWFKVTVVGVVIAGGLLVYWIINSRSRTKAENWARIDRGDRVSLIELFNDAKETKQGQAARFTVGFNVLWDSINTLSMQDPDKLKQIFMQITGHFGDLAEECKEEPERCAEAKYHMAVATESMAAVEIGPLKKKHLEDAKKILADVAQGDLKGTAYGMMAQKRLELFNNPAEFQRMEKFYEEFGTGVRVGKALGPQ
ncbi:MAG TPA: hypothetical protein VE988_06800 [Gemmataceae bacterium]|nr:hypothetical protein [Gemmataceae bacterium]